MKMKKSELLKLMYEFEDNCEDIPYFCVEINNLDTPSIEYIVNSHASIPYKIAYYSKAYDEDLKLYANNRISIVDAYPIEVMRKRI